MEEACVQNALLISHISSIILHSTVGGVGLVLARQGGVPLPQDTSLVGGP